MQTRHFQFGNNTFTRDTHTARTGPGRKPKRESDPEYTSHRETQTVRTNRFHALTALTAPINRMFRALAAPTIQMKRRLDMHTNQSRSRIAPFRSANRTRRSCRGLVKGIGALAALSLTLCVRNAHAQGTLQVVGEGSNGAANLLAYQTSNSVWSAGFALPPPTLPAGDNWTNLMAMSQAEDNTLQVVRTDTKNNLYLVSWQDSSQNWHAGFKLPSAKLPINDHYAHVVASKAEGNTLQVVGGDAVNSVYLISWQDSGGKWHAGFKLPSAKLPAGVLISQIALSQAEGNTLQLIGLDGAGNVWLLSWQDSNGKWHAGFKLPCPAGIIYGSIAVRQAGSTLQVVGLDYFTGQPYLISWQDFFGNWYAGFALPSPTLPAGDTYTQIAIGLVNGILEVVGLDSYGVPYLISWGAPGGSWFAGIALPNPAPTGTFFRNITTAQGADGNLQVIGTDNYNRLWLMDWQVGSGANVGAWGNGELLPSSSTPCYDPITANSP